MASQQDDTKLFNELDKEEQDRVISQKAEEIASKKVQELQSSLSKALGNEQKRGYSSFDEMQEDIDRRAEEKAKTYAEQVKEDLRKEREAEEEARKKKAEAEVNRTKEQQKAEWEKMSAEWREAVADGVAPSVDSAVAEKLKAGTKWDDLTEKERQDPGLVFYNKAREVHAELRKEGKAVSFYRTLSQMDKKPVGSRAPVFGGAVASPSNDDDFEYDELHSATKSIFGI